MMTALQWQGRICGSVLTVCMLAGVLTAWAQSPAVKASSDTAKSDVVSSGESKDPRRAKLIADTRRMLTLSLEVKAAMANSPTDTLSLGTLKKVEELQKLAVTVKAEISKLP